MKNLFISIILFFTIIFSGTANANGPGWSFRNNRGGFRNHNTIYGYSRWNYHYGYRNTYHYVYRGPRFLQTVIHPYWIWVPGYWYWDVNEQINVWIPGYWSLR